MSKVLLYGLEEGVARDLCSALASQTPALEAAESHHVDDCIAQIRRHGADFVFSSFSADLVALLDAIRSVQPELPVVVVSRNPQVHEWLDALEAGAADYCGAPFETEHLNWILKAHKPSRPPC
ncbi:MAG: hypothetical protein HY235_12675 [Acidobacteria bacterium]|nr:hypothetical protein [Acidobacteriota bacterium]